MPLTPREFRENLARRFAETYEEDEREAKRLRSLMPRAVKLITDHLGPRRVVLFGSLATNIFLAAFSDVDLAIEGVGMEAPADLIRQLSDLFNRKVDIVDPDLVADHVRRDIDDKGIVLHEP